MHLKRPVIPFKAFKRHRAIATLTTATMLAPSKSLFRIPPEISLNNNNFYTGPPKKLTASSQHHAITAPKKSASSTPKRRSRGVPLFPPRSEEALEAWVIDSMLFYLGPWFRDSV